MTGSSAGKAVPRAVHVATAAPIVLAGARFRILLSGIQTGGAFSLLDMASPPGSATPLHVHAREEETLHQLAGEMEATIDGRTVTLTTGQTLLLPRGVPHRLRNAGPVPARSLLICSPAGFEDFVAGAGLPAPEEGEVPPPDEAAIARMVTLAEAFGIAILAP